MERWYQRADSEYSKQETERFETHAARTRGERLKRESLAVTAVGGTNIADLSDYARPCCAGLSQNPETWQTQTMIAEQISEETDARLIW